MDWHISGAYIASCSCAMAEHWPIDATLGDTHGGCKGVIVFAIQDGTSDRAELSGVTFAIVNIFPPDLAEEGWSMGLVVNESASIDQLQAIEGIISGRNGGPFEDMSGMLGEYIGNDRSPISIERSPAPIVKIGTSIAFKFHPTVDAEGNRVLGGHALFPWGTERVGGKADGPPGRIFGQVWTPHFAEYARFDIDPRRLGVQDQIGRLRNVPRPQG